MTADVGSAICDDIRDFNKKFNEAKLMAKKTGKLLGCALAIG